MYFLVALPPLVIIIVIAAGFFLSAPYYKGPASSHFTGIRFINYDNIKAKGFLDVMKWMLNRDQGEWTEIKKNSHTKPRAQEDSLTVYFVNHATFLIQWNGLNILTDPIWSERTSPFSFAGPKRMRPPGIKFENLPSIDLVLISHNHYDHLDVPTLQRLWERDQPKYIVPLGVDIYLQKKKINETVALDWWEAEKMNQLNIEMMPAVHFSGRGMLDRDKTLWGGYMLSDGKRQLYFAGDTGYNEKMFGDIKKKYPAIDVALLPIGAYKPQWFMSPIHVSPEEAVVIHQQLNPTLSVGMHYGTFPLADDGQYESPKDLKEAIEKYKVDPAAFILLKEGEQI